MLSMMTYSLCYGDLDLIENEHSLLRKLFRPTTQAGESYFCPKMIYPNPISSLKIVEMALTCSAIYRSILSNEICKQY